MSGGGDEQETVAVPTSIVGAEQATARTELARLGLEVGQTKEEYHDEVKEDHVISTDPEPGANVERGSSVNLVISKGKEPPPLVEVPDVTGKSYAEAKSQLEAAGFDVKRESETNDQVPRNNVIRQDPAGGQKVRQKSDVTLWVSAGPSNIKVPDLFNASERSACSQLNSLGLRCKKETQPAPPDRQVAPGQVFQQSPGP
ncbi:PASTA domain-containing protein, partial [Actinomadura adrarensis]